MLSGLRTLLAPPISSDNEEKSRAALILNILGWSTLFIVAGILLMRLVQQNDPNLVEVNWILAGILVAIGLVLYLTRTGSARAASVLFLATLWAGLSYVAWVADGIRDVTFSAYTIVILIAGLLLGWRGTAVVALLSILSGWGLAYAETIHLIEPTLDQPLNFARDMTGVFLLMGISIYLMMTGLQQALRRSRRMSAELASSNSELEVMRVELEQRVEQRTFDLRKRAGQLEAVSAVARAVASVQDLDTLLPAVTKLVSQQFGFYHVGIFLLDQQRQNAILRAANSQGGLRMLSRHHSLPLDEHSIVGYATSRGEARIALDVGSDAVYFSNPDLPETRSEMAIPLRVAGNVIGALDVQSKETNAFSPEDIGVLTTLADQIAVAIENARLFGETRQALDESRLRFERYTQQEWSRFARQARQSAFLFDGKHVVPLEGSPSRETVEELLQSGRPGLERATSTIAVPIKLRGQTIGVLDIRAKSGNRTWRQEEIAMLEAAAERAALALENARLIESAQRRAARERAIGEISNRIGSMSNLESILQTAVEELGRKIGGAAEVTLEISPVDGQENRSGDV